MRLEDEKMKKFLRTVLVFSIFLAFSGTAYTDDRDGGLEFKARLTGDQEVIANQTPPLGTGSPAIGRIEVEFDKGFTKLDVDLRVSTNTIGTIFRAHFHCGRPGQNGPIIFGLFDPGPFPVSNIVKGTLTNADSTGADCVPTIGRVVNNLASLAFAMRDGLIYANVHTTPDFPGGELRGQMIEVIDDDDKDHRFHRR
jgi:CHRD domain